MEETRGSQNHEQLLSLSPCPILRMILIGEREAGKSAVGNAILGTKAFDQVGVRTRVSIKREGMIRGRKVVVVDTPGWEWFNLEGSRASSGSMRKEMIASMKLCQPGAHVLLLVVPLSFSFSGRERHVVEEHVELFGPEAWSHTLVLFTLKDIKQLRSSSLEEKVEDNEELEKLLEKCGRRYHALYSQRCGGKDLVAELLAKIQKMVNANGESLLLSKEVLELARKRVEEEERYEENERKERQEKVQKMKEKAKKKEMDERKKRMNKEEELSSRQRGQEKTAKSFESQDSSEMSSISDYHPLCCKTQ